MKRLFIVVLTVLFLFGVSYAGEVTVDIGGEFKFVWEANIESDVIGYRIYLSTTAGEYVYGAGNEYTSVGVMTNPESGPHSIGTEGIYYFVVTAFDAGGHESEPSEEQTAYVVDMPPGAPQGCQVLEF